MSDDYIGLCNLAHGITDRVDSHLEELSFERLMQLRGTLRDERHQSESSGGPPVVYEYLEVAVSNEIRRRQSAQSTDSAAEEADKLHPIIAATENTVRALAEGARMALLATVRVLNDDHFNSVMCSLYAEQNADGAPDNKLLGFVVDVLEEDTDRRIAADAVDAAEQEPDEGTKSPADEWLKRHGYHSKIEMPSIISKFVEGGFQPIGEILAVKPLPNPMRFPDLEPERIAETICAFWNAGIRQPELKNRVWDVHPTLDIGTFNVAADRAWRLVSAEERGNDVPF